MTGFVLSSPRQAEDPLARFFLAEGAARLSVSEDVAFAGCWLGMGTLTLRTLARERPDLVAAVRRGNFQWDVPTVDEVAGELRGLFGFTALPEARRKSAEERLRSTLGRMASMAVRAGLVRPRFDARSLAEMPFRRPTTIVADTSGVLQGAMGFIADHLHPMARLKIPAILHMEVVNQADRFLKTRRSDGVRGETVLGEHLVSQTGQRTLLRLELRQDAEVERNLLLSDPLRSAFKEDRDPELRDLNLSVPLRSYVDRLILEAARQHQGFANPGHPVRLLTADQGLARMALAEGISPLFFKANTSDQLFGRALSGVTLHPFDGTLTGCPLPGLIWELATAFGKVRLDRPDGSARIEVVAIDAELGWSAFHSHEDLLWMRTGGLTDWPRKPSPPRSDAAPGGGASGGVSADGGAPIDAADAAPRGKPTVGRVGRGEHKRKLSPGNSTNVAFYRFTPGSLVSLVDHLSEVSRLDLPRIGSVVGVNNPRGISEYGRFLESGGLIRIGGDDWIATERLLALATAQREKDRYRMSELLEEVPSYRTFLDLLRTAPDPRRCLELPIPQRVQQPYLALGEVTGICAGVPGEGHYATLARPSIAEFADMALDRFAEVGPSDGLVSTGEWLESLVRTDGVHPAYARDALQEADSAGLLLRSTEGSTTDTRHDDHTLKVLTTHEGRPIVGTEHLYRGDFLIPGRASSSLRLARGAP